MPPTKKKAAPKTVVVKDDPLVELKDKEVAPAPRRPGRPAKSIAAPVAPKFSMLVVTPSSKITLSFDDQNEYNHAYQQIAFKCGSNRFAMVKCDGKEYTFCNVEYIIRDL